MRAAADTCQTSAQQERANCQAICDSDRTMAGRQRIISPRAERMNEQVSASATVSLRVAANLKSQMLLKALGTLG